LLQGRADADVHVRRAVTRGLEPVYMCDKSSRSSPAVSQLQSGSVPGSDFAIARRTRQHYTKHYRKLHNQF